MINNCWHLNVIPFKKKGGENLDCQKKSNENHYPYLEFERVKLSKSWKWLVNYLILLFFFKQYLAIFFCMNLANHLHIIHIIPNWWFTIKNSWLTLSIINVAACVFHFTNFLICFFLHKLRIKNWSMSQITQFSLICEYKYR